jgi:hypothetical protein
VTGSRLQTQVLTKGEAGKEQGYPFEVPVKHKKTLCATGGQGTGSDSMKDGQGAADHAIFQGLDKPPVGASKPWSP